MFDTTWADLPRWQRELDAANVVPPEPRWDLPVARLALTHWEEHCHECAVPQCYTECLVYRARADKRCRRFDYGCVSDRRFPGSLGYGIDVRFGRWAKLETEFHAAVAPPWMARAIDRVSRFAAWCARRVSPLLFFAQPIRRATWALDHARNILLRQVSRWSKPAFNVFAVEAYSLETCPVPLIVQCTTPAKGAFYRRSLILQPGRNRFELPFREFGIESTRGVRVSVFPENDLNARVVFTWLDFVELASLPENAISAGRGSESRPADTVKCIAWDLDNTLWDGVLVEDGQERLRLRADVIEVIRTLDRRGIIHTVVSKNTHEQAWAALEALGVQEYFVFPAINWGRKSDNLVQVAKRINIGLDTIAFVDDSPFEREEVRSSLPMVRVFSERDAVTLPAQPCLAVPETEMSSQRRLSYRAEMLREEFKVQSAGDDVAYLRACEIRAAFFHPTTPEQVNRCHELVQRSNQLNLCTRRYSAQEFEALLKRKDVESFAMRCVDRFGDYGLVGFVSVQLGEAPMLMDLVLSCRVAKRRVEHALMKWLGQRYLARGETALRATLVHTARNAVLAEVFNELPFEVGRETPSQTDYVLPLERAAGIDDIVTVVDFLPETADKSA